MKTLKLRHVARLINSNVDKVIDPDETPVHLCNYVHVYRNERIGGNIEFDLGSASATEIERFGLRCDDVIITKDSEDRADIAVPAHVPNDMPGVVCGYHLAILRPDPRQMRGDFLAWSLRARNLQDAAMLGALGVTRFGLSQGAIKSMDIPCPSLVAQRTIAGLLDVETARVDALIEKKKRFAAMSDERWRGALDAAIHGDEGGGRSTGVWSDPIVPSGWTITPLKHLTDLRRPIMYGIVLPGPNVDEGVMIVKGGDVKPDRLDPDRLCKTTVEIEAGYARSRLKSGDLVIAIRGGIGDIEIVPSSIEGANLTQDAARIAPRAGVDNRWLRYALMAPSVFAPLAAKATGTAVKGINIFDLKRVRIPAPPTEVQIAIADRLDAEATRIWRLRRLVEVHAERLREFRSALITAAVNGQIDPEAWRRRGDSDRRLDRIEAEMATEAAE